ncbi:MAG: sigma-70 family RNA polymerase sigma factor [Thermoguttaceae bacterium]|nr:sigma-70 family RNA polymerase sigma factor [Thermoguttaceae bacterium]
MKNESDERLIERFQSGERAAFDEIARRYRPRLLRFLRLRTRSLESAEDLTQETLMKAFASLGALRRGEFFSGWLHRVAFRTLVDSTRRRRLDVASFDENKTLDALNGEASNVVFAMQTTPRRPNGAEFDVASPEERVVRDDEGENIWRVAREILTPKEFKTLWLRYVDEATDAEIALALGATPGAVRVSLTRARQKLIVRLRPKTDGEKTKREL